jgi:ribonuclease Z
MDATALVHESTNAHIPRRISEKVRGLGGSKATVESVRTKAIGRGHSTADMAGEFAKKIRARRLYLNHFSTRYVSFPLPFSRGIERTNYFTRRFCPGGQSPALSSSKPGPRSNKPPAAIRARQDEATLVMDEIERQASEAWGMGHAVAANDLMTVEILQHELLTPIAVAGLVGVINGEDTAAQLEAYEEVKRTGNI